MKYFFAQSIALHAPLEFNILLKHIMIAKILVLPPQDYCGKQSSVLKSSWVKGNRVKGHTDRTRKKNVNKVVFLAN